MARVLGIQSRTIGQVVTGSLSVEPEPRSRMECPRLRLFPAATVALLGHTDRGAIKISTYLLAATVQQQPRTKLFL